MELQRGKSTELHSCFAIYVYFLVSRTLGVLMSLGGNNGLVWRQHNTGGAFRLIFDSINFHFLRPVHCCPQVRLDGSEPNSSIPVNSDDIAVPFETPLFKGRLLVRVAGLPSGIPGQGDGAQAYFRGKKRLMQCAVQVRFFYFFFLFSSIFDFFFSDFVFSDFFFSDFFFSDFFSISGFVLCSDCAFASVFFSSFPHVSSLLVLFFGGGRNPFGWLPNLLDFSDMVCFSISIK